MTSTTILHASCVALDQSAVLIMGASGTGKSALSLEMMSRGAVLIADDRTIISVAGQGLVATCPAAIRGQIEARGVGILAADYKISSPVRLAVNLDKTEGARLPQHVDITLLGVTIPLLNAAPFGHFPAAILQFLRGGRIA